MMAEDKYYEVDKLSKNKVSIHNLWNDNIYIMKVTHSEISCTCPHSKGLKESNKNEVNKSYD